MTMLCFADTDTPCFGDVYNGMDTMVEKVKVSIQKHENDPTKCEALCNKVEAIIHHLWEKMTTPLHLLAYALSSRYYSEQVLRMPGRVAPYADEEVANGRYKAFTRLFPGEEMHDTTRQEFGLFATGLKMSPFAIKDQHKMGAITWYYMYGQPYKHLQGLAIKILSQKVEDLVYIHTNLRLLSRNENEYKEGSTKLWDVASECANLDATLHDLITTIDDGDDTITHGASSTSGTVLGSNDLELAVGDDENV